ncbi:ORF20A [Aviadenovirus phalacrocoracidae]|uniref:ORF20A n=1 Tax=Aviadenovirus sp. TaxID=2217649 RepID=A0ABZ0T4K3_9ADEN|nr:ORF20A [Aviadenovirus sp.]
MQKVCYALLVALAGVAYCCAVVISYLFLQDLINKLTFVLTVFGSITLLVTIVFLVLIGRSDGGCVPVQKKKKPTVGKRKKDTGPESCLRWPFSFPRSSQNVTVSINPNYLPLIQCRPLPAVAIPFASPAGSDADESCYGSREDDHCYEEIDEHQL